MISPAEIVRRLQIQLSNRQKFWSVRRYFVRDNEPLNEHLGNLFGDEPIPFVVWLGQLSVLDSRTNIPMLGADPVLSIGAGTVCLLISVLLLAASSQPLSTWVSCVVITLLKTISMVTSMFTLGRGLFLPMIMAVLSTETIIFLQSMEGVMFFARLMRRRGI